MTPFEFLSVALSFVLGLGVTLLLRSVLSLFRNRRNTKLDWIPITWSWYILLFQFAFWWGLFGLSELESWALPNFGILLFMSLVIFIAGGLVLPAGNDTYPKRLENYFRRDGKWGLVALAAYMIVAIVANVIMWKYEPFSMVNLLHILGIGLLAVVVLSHKRLLQVFGTILFGVIMTVTAVLDTEWAY